MKEPKLTMSYQPFALRTVDRHGAVTIKGKRYSALGLIRLAGLPVSIERGQVGARGREWQASDLRGLFARCGSARVYELVEGLGVQEG